MKPLRESEIMRRCMLKASELGMRLLRFQVGNFLTMDGRPVKVGVPGVSDLIGWRTVEITPDMVGTRIAQFVAVETKTTRGRATKGQAQFLSVVADAGGAALLARSEDDLSKL